MEKATKLYSMYYVFDYFGVDNKTQFSKLYEIQKIMIKYNLCLLYTSDTLVSAIKNIDRFKQRAEFSTWLITIASNKYKDYLRKHKETDILLDVLPSSYSLENEIVNKDEVKRLDVYKRQAYTDELKYGDELKIYWE